MPSLSWTRGAIVQTTSEKVGSFRIQVQVIDRIAGEQRKVARRALHRIEHQFKGDTHDLGFLVDLDAVFGQHGQGFPGSVRLLQPCP